MKRKIPKTNGRCLQKEAAGEEDQEVASIQFSLEEPLLGSTLF